MQITWHLTDAHYIPHVGAKVTHAEQDIQKTDKKMHPFSQTVINNMVDYKIHKTFDYILHHFFFLQKLGF